jgi:hypothetical protein
MADLPRDFFMERMTRRYARALSRHRRDAVVRPSVWRQIAECLAEGYVAGIKDAGALRRRPGPGE